MEYYHAWITLLLLLGMFVVLIKTKLKPDIVLFCTVAVLTLSGCLDVKGALSGFSADSVVSVGILYVVVTGLEATGALNWISGKLFGKSVSYASSLLKLMIPIAFMSSFLNNPTVVSLFNSIVRAWGRKLNILPSKLLIPLAYATTLGGVCTLIGASPNLVVACFFNEGTNLNIGFFSPTIPAFACLVVGVLVILLLRKYIPERVEPLDELSNANPTLTTELRIRTNHHLVGLSLAEARICEQYDDCTLIGILHFDGYVEHITETTDLDSVFLMGGDTLVFSGNRGSVRQIARSYNFQYEGEPLYGSKKAGSKAILASVIMMLMVVLSATGAMPLINCCFLAAVLMLFTRCCTAQQCKTAINWSVLLTIACSVSIGSAIHYTNLDSLLSYNIIQLCGDNPFITFIILCTLANITTEFLSSSACAAVFAPIGMKMALDMGVNPATFCIGLIIAVSSSYATPIGSVPNMMVFVPGGYRFSDFARVGVPLNIAMLVTNIIVTPLVYPLYSF